MMGASRDLLGDDGYSSKNKIEKIKTIKKKEKEGKHAHEGVIRYNFKAFFS